MENTDGPPTKRQRLESSFFNIEENPEKIIENDFKNASRKSRTGTIANNMLKPKYPISNVKALNFYWLDAYEASSLNEKGTILLFGKTLQQNEFVSCCVIVSVPRKLYVVPRKFVVNETGEETTVAVGYQDVHTEFNEKYLMPIKVFTFKTRMINKRLLSSNEPTNVMEVEYSAKCNQVQFDPSKPASTFSDVYGTKTRFLETFLLDRKIKGPCWLNLCKFGTPSTCITQCKVEVECQFLDNITKIEDPTLSIPPIITATLNLQQTGENDIILLSCIVEKHCQLDAEPDELYFDEHFSVFSDLTIPQNLQRDLCVQLGQYDLTAAHKTNSCRAMLNVFIYKLSKIDPDVIIGYSVFNKFMKILHENLISHKIDIRAKLSRLKEPNCSSNCLFTGRIVCDIEKTVQQTHNLKMCNLKELSSEVLDLSDDEIVDLENDDIEKAVSFPSGLFKLITFNIHECLLMLRIVHKCKSLHLAFEMSLLTGSTLSKSLLCGRLNLVESLLSHSFYSKGILLPDSEENREIVDEDQLQGGLVLNPVVGFYNYILLLDFRSLYPSIIQEYNICFTTETGTASGVLPLEMKKLVDMRNTDCTDVKKQVLKLLANSVYGCLGSQYSRYYGKPLAQLITSKGREILTNVVKIVEDEFKLTVIYGDTDSVMIKTNLPDYYKCIELGEKIVEQVNNLYSIVKLKVENVFSRFLLQNKKKYAGVAVKVDSDGELFAENIYKGVDIVRRNYSHLARSVGKMVLNEVLKEQLFELTLLKIQQIVNETVSDLRNGLVPLQSLVITSRINKPLDSYTNRVPIYITAALKYNEEFNNALKNGDLVPYVICVSKDQTETIKFRQALHVLHFKKSDEFAIDVDYYLNHELFPILRRLCSPLDEIRGTMNAFLEGFTRDVIFEVQNEKRAVRKVDDNGKYEEFTFVCEKCKQENRVDNLLRKNQLSLTKCMNNKCEFQPMFQSSIHTNLLDKLDDFVKKYDSMVYECDNKFCKKQFVNYEIPEDGECRCNICNCGDLHQIYTESVLYSQLIYYKGLFDTSTVKAMMNIECDLQVFYDKLLYTVYEFIDNCSYCNILDLEKICGKNEYYDE